MDRYLKTYAGLYTVHFYLDGINDQILHVFLLFLLLLFFFFEFVFSVDDNGVYLELKHY